MKILFLSENSATSTSGSAQLHRFNKLMEGLETFGIETEFLSLPEMPIRRPLLLTPLNLPFVQSKIRGFDFIHAMGDTAYTAILWKLIAGSPVIYDVDADTLAEAYMYWDTEKSLRNAFRILQTAIMNWISYRSKDPFITVSNPLLKRLINQKGVPPNLLYIVRNGVDIQQFRPLDRGTDEIFTICYAGGFHIWQGIDNLIAAAQILKGKPIRFKIIGFRKEDEELKEKIAAKLGNMVDLVDRVSQAELIEHLSKAHFLIIPRLPHPAIEIAFPTKFSEYLAIGKPVIITDVDETASMVREYKCGLVSEPAPQALAETIQQAAELSNAELVKMGQNGRHLAETIFDWKVVCRNYANLLEEWYKNGG